MNLNDIKKTYFIGIGGIGMSALARYFRFNGVAVHGYDRTESALTRKLAAEGMKIHYEEDLQQIPAGVDLVVYTPAVPDTHLELQYFREQGFPVKKRAEVLGIISRSKKTAAVAGTHGKTTTSSLLAHILRACDVPVTAFLGGIAQNFGSNFIWGESDWVVVEADEYDRSFLHLHPDAAVIMSMDADHLDIYGDKKALQESGFRAFARQLKPGGKLWIQEKWQNELGAGASTHSFGIENGEVQAKNIHVSEGYFVFDYESEAVSIKGLKLPLPGRHNVENATAAITLALHIGAAPEKIAAALEAFKGVARRFDFIVRKKDRVYIDDYAHHPEELKAAIGAAREFYPGKRITGLFQPHLFTRTRDFVDGFAEALDLLDEAILLDIYPAREAPIPGVTSEIILDRMKMKHKSLLSRKAALDKIKEERPEVLLSLGAGDIDRLVEPIKEIMMADK
jgi:UDP-N-acetylmuramate--alanine ligase